MLIVDSLGELAETARGQEGNQDVARSRVRGMFKRGAQIDPVMAAPGIVKTVPEQHRRRRGLTGA